MTVAEAIAGSCSTLPLRGLALECIAELNALLPGALVPVAAPQVVAAGPNVHLWLQPAARAALMHVLADRPTHTMRVNSALRTLPEQLAVRTWYEEKRCGITLAAEPGGNAPHCLGIALDVQQPEAWREAFHANGWRWLGPEGDLPHFEYRGGGCRDDVGSLSVKAAQTLLVRHGAKIAVDSSWGPATRAALLRAPASGWEP